MDTSRGSLPADTQIGRTALHVTDLDAMRDFYADIVGLTVQERTETRAVLGAGAVPLVILSTDHSHEARTPAAAGLFHTAIRVPSRAALGDALTRIRDAWTLDGASDHGVSEALYLSDPEDNGVEIYWDRPRAEWPRENDGGVRMYTAPLDVDAVAGAAAGAERVPEGTDIGHVHLEVTSLTDFEAVYVDTLGFERQTTYDGARFVGAGGYHHHIGANIWHGRTEGTAGTGLAWFEVVVPEESDLDAVRNRLQDGGIDVTDSGHSITFTDADDITVRVRPAGSPTAEF